MAYRKDWPQPQMGNQGFARTMKVFGRSVNFATGDLLINNTIGLFVVPKDFVLTAMLATVVPDLDTGTSTLRIALGDALLSTRILAADAIFSTGGAMPALAASGFLYRFPTDTEILATVTVAANVAAAGAVPIYLQGFIGP
jgi:hypothetical protein